jgi:hypothetical protein
VINKATNESHKIITRNELLVLSSGKQLHNHLNREEFCLVGLLWLCRAQRAMKIAEFRFREETEL